MSKNETTSDTGRSQRTVGHRCVFSKSRFRFKDPPNDFWRFLLLMVLVPLSGWPFRWRCRIWRIGSPWTYLEEVTFEFLALFWAFLFDFSSYVCFINFEEQPPLQTIAAKNRWVKLEKRKELLEAFYEERFGTKRRTPRAKYYAVAPEQNIGGTEIQELS